MVQKGPMSESQWRKELCGTCEYWGGERELGFQNVRLMYVHAQYNPQPKCAGALGGTIQNANNRPCNAYKRWHKLP